MRVLFSTPECVPFAKVGGLGDVVGALPKVLHARGHDVRVVLPLYGSVPRDGLQRHLAPLGVPMGSGEAWAALWEGRLPGSDVPIYFIEHQEAFGGLAPYGMTDDHEIARFALLCQGTLQVARAVDFSPDVFHLHDWPTAMLAPMVRSAFSGAASVFTMHNVAHQPTFAPSGLSLFGLGSEVLHPGGVEDYGAVNPFKAGVNYADLLTTVSPHYAWEITTPEGGAGLHEAFRARQRDLIGILNGIDESVWNPAADPMIPARFDAADLSGKELCKRALQGELGLEPLGGAPLIGMVCRVGAQKGVDLVAAGLDAMVEMGAQVAVLGAGDPRLEAALVSAAERWPGRARVTIGYDEGLAHRIEAGADMFLMPSRFEPCGLNQLYSQRYGTPPIVRRVGGLADSVEPRGATNPGTGFVFGAPELGAMLDAVRDAVGLYRDDPGAFRAMQAKGMSRAYGWNRAAAAYEEAYRQALDRAARRAAA